MNERLQEYSRLAGLVGAAMVVSGLVRQNIEGVWGWVNIAMVAVGGSAAARIGGSQLSRH
jgi:hypothetical protein